MKDKKISEVLLNLFLLIFGVCLVIWADKVTNIVSILLGILAIIYGGIACFIYFKNKEMTISKTLYLIYGIIVLVLGFILVFKVDLIKELISFVVGIYIIIFSILKLIETLSIQKKSGINLTFAIVIAIIGIILGIFCVTSKFIIPDMIVMVIGIMLIIYSIIFIVDYFYLKRYEGIDLNEK